MARITLSFLLTALFLAGSSSAVTHHPGADVLGFTKRSPAPVPVVNVGRVGHAGTLVAPATRPAAVKRHRRAAKGAKRSANHNERSVVEAAPEPMKRDLNTPSSSAGKATLNLERAHGAFGETRGLHPQVYLQQHINRGVRRHAKMTGRDLGADIDDHFEGAIRKRWVDAHGSDADLVLRKRARLGHVASESVTTGFENVEFIGGQQQEQQAAGQQAAGGQAAAGGASSASQGFSEADLKALEQNTVTQPTKPTASNSLGLAIEADDVGYFATIQLGTPPKNFKMLTDSGSSDTWVPGEQCKSCGNTHTTLGATTSSSFVASNTPFEVTYGTGAVQGTIAQDTMTIAGLSLKNHTFGVTTDETQQFSSAQVPFDGLMGLAQQGLSEEKTPTPIDSLAQQKLVSANQVGFALGRVADGTNDGEITFGGIDQTKVAGQLTLIKNVNKQGFWEGAMDDVTVNGKSLNLAGRTAILDTGTTLLVVPQADAEAIHAAIPGAKNDGQNGFTLPCTTTAKVALSFGGKAFTIDPRDLAFQPLTNNLKGTCASAISAGQIGGAKEWLAGDTFLKSVYYAVDTDNNQIGLGARVAA